MEPLRVLRGYLSWFLLGLIFLILLGFLWSWISSPLTVTVMGRGEIDVPAAFASLTFTIEDTNLDPQSAVNLVKAKADSARLILINNGANEDAIFESKASMVPASTATQGGSGYQAMISMGAKNLPVANLDTLIPTLYKNGASLVTQPVITVDNQEKLETQALDEALKDANKKAGVLAKKHWKFIKKSTNIVQTPTQPTSILQKTNEQLPSQEGTYKIIKTVTVSYRMW